MPRKLWLIVLVAVTGALAALSGTALGNGYQLSLQNEDRRNQIGSAASKWEVAAWFDVGDLEIRATLGFDQRGIKVPGYKHQPPVSLRWGSSRFRYLVGVDHLPDWGYGRTGSLVLSSDTPTVPHVYWALGMDRATYEKLVGVLDYGAKYLFAHRIALQLTRNFEFTASEVSVVSDHAAAVPINYLPGWPVYLSQHFGLGDAHNKEINANISVGGRWESPWGLVYGDLLVDDMPQDPTHYDAYLVALQVGYARSVAFLGRPTIFGAEYTRASNWMYTFRDLPYSYTHQGYVLGHWIGPDGDLLDVSLRFPVRSDGWNDLPTAGRTVGFSYQFRRKGEGKIGDDWEKFGTEYAREHSFLTGVVESGHSLGVQVDWPVNDRLRLEGSVRVESVLHANHEYGRNGVRSGFSVGLRAVW